MSARALALTLMLASLAPQSALAQTLDPSAVTLELAAIHGQRDLAIGLWASGGILMTAGGFGTFGYAFPGNSFITILFCAGAAAIGLGLLVAAAAVQLAVHARWDRLRDAGLVLAPDGLGVRF